MVLEMRNSKRVLWDENPAVGRAVSFWRLHGRVQTLDFPSF